MSLGRTLSLILCWWIVAIGSLKVLFIGSGEDASEGADGAVMEYLMSEGHKATYVQDADFENRDTNGMEVVVVRRRSGHLG